MQSQVLNFHILKYLTKCTFQKTLKKGKNVCPSCGELQ